MYGRTLLLKSHGDFRKRSIIGDVDRISKKNIWEGRYCSKCTWGQHVHNTAWVGNYLISLQHHPPPPA